MPKSKRTMFADSAQMDVLSYNSYLNRLIELAVSMFEWKNLPDTCDERYLETRLFIDGKAVFFYDDIIGYLSLSVIDQGRLDVYGNPIERRGFSAYNNFQASLNDKNSVLIWNNALHTNSYTDACLFAQRLAQLDRIIDVNVNAQKTPIMIQGDEKQRLTLLNLYKNYDGNVPVIFGDKNLDLRGVKSISTNAPFVADKLYELKIRLWNEALTYLGISNTGFQKKERLISDEAIRSAGSTIASRYSRLNARRKACEQINDMFGLNVECNFREDYREADDEVMFPGQTGDDTGSDDTVVGSSMVYDIRTK